MGDEDTQICEEAIAACGTISPVFLMRKKRCTLQHALKIIHAFHMQKQTEKLEKFIQESGIVTQYQENS